MTIADLGIGIEASLRRNPRNEKRIKEAGAIRTALEKGVTARPEKCGGGIGLFQFTNYPAEPGQSWRVFPFRNVHPNP